MAEKENVLVKTNDFIRYFLPKIEKMPRNYKFIIGDRIVKIQLDFLELLIEAYYSTDKPNKTKLLIKANILLEQLRHLMQLCVDMKFIGIGQFEHTSKLLYDIGISLGGWIKFLQKQQASA
ncbi:diversity-generating retroelement protein Avd [candidate division KSB1 bacterium]|nr:diversity-generating retroelement protein Avd [candidate division KSB1 bacterium]